MRFTIKVIFATKWTNLTAETTLLKFAQRKHFMQVAFCCGVACSFAECLHRQDLKSRYAFQGYGRLAVS